MKEKYGVRSIPGREEDGSDGVWFVTQDGWAVSPGLRTLEEARTWAVAREMRTANIATYIDTTIGHAECCGIAEVIRTLRADGLGLLALEELIRRVREEEEGEKA